MRRTLIATTALALSLLGTGAAAAAESPSPSPSLSASEAPEVDASTSPSVAPEPSPVSPSPSVAPKPSPEQDGDDAALERTGLEVPTFTCDTDPADDLVLPQDTEGVTYTLANGVFTATPNEGYQWDFWFFSDPWVDPSFSGFPPGFRIPEVGPTEPIAIPVADMAFPHCNHDDETTVSVTTECVDGTGYLNYDIDAWWATDEVQVQLYSYTHDEALRGHVVFKGTGLTGSLAWDGSTPGMKSELGPIGSGVNLPDVNDPLFWVHSGGSPEHEAVVKVDFEADDPCLGATPGAGDGDGAAGDDTAGGDSAGGSDDGVLAATGPEAAWLTAGIAALLVAVGTTLVAVRRRLRA